MTKSEAVPQGGLGNSLPESPPSVENIGLIED